MSFLLLGLAALGLPESARGDLIILKDGFIIQGNVRREGVTEFDPGSKEVVWMPKGLFLVDDVPRRIYFSPTRVRIVEKLAAPTEIKVAVKHGKLLLNPREMPPILEVNDAPEFNSRWERTLRLRTAPPGGAMKVPQILAELTPYYFRGDALERVRWHAAYLTRELSPATVHALLGTHPDFLETGKLTQAQIVTRRMRRIDFYGQAGWFDLARKELDRLLKDIPEQKERVQAAHLALTRLEARDRLEEIKRWQQGGRHLAVRKALADFPEKDVPEQILSDIRTLRTKDAHAQVRMKEATDFLAECGKACTEPNHKLLVEASAAIRNELHLDNLDRLDSFLGQARQAERDKKAGRKPTRSPAELLALAASGWLLGSPSAEARPESALDLWKTREMILHYLVEEDAPTRKKMLAEHPRNLKSRVELDEVAQLIPTLPPITPARDLGPTPATRTVGNGRSSINYQIQLPPEYSHSRSYPVLIVLHNSGEKASTMLERWSGGAAENGYILVAPEWDHGLGSKYNYSEAEHATVLKTLQDLRRSYRVDSDRVFLFGLGEGANMAFDVGLANPSLFAGVMPMGAAPFYFPGRCWRNAQYLPLYVVNGSLAGESNVQLRQIFTFWALRAYPSLWVSYKGRGQEWFSGEVPNLFDWMRRQSRALPLHELGTDGLGGSFGNEFTMLRPNTNHFYWLDATEIDPRCTVSMQRWNNLVNPAMVTARTDPDTNEMVIKSSGVFRLTVQVVRTARGQYNIDPDKPLTIRVGFKPVWVNRRVTSSMDVLLEDLHQRGDRQHLVVGRVELKLR
jgi:hypothetical protein